jgi:cytochrome c oxidase assembly protein subunit 15
LDEAQTPVAAILTIGFGTSVAMWAIGYVGHMPFGQMPSAVFLPLILLANLAGGVCVGRYTRRGLAGGAWIGGVAALLNLLILGSKLVKPETGHLLPEAWLWLPGSLVLSVTLGTLGAALGGLVPSPRKIDWPAALAWVACSATLLLITAGGMVTGFRAGLAVPDWPNSYGSNMFLFPLKSMTEVRGAYYEHAHRLLGTLVGLSGLTLAIYLTMTSRDRVLRRLVWVVFGAIAFQGLLGGLRVTGRLTTSQVQVAPNPILAVIHGVFAHFVLGGLVAVAVLAARRWRSTDEPPLDAPGAETDYALTWGLVALIVLQTFLGTLLRQQDILLLTHITVAVLVFAIALFVAMRLWGLYGRVPTLRRAGLTLLAVLSLQVAAGIVALVIRDPASLAVVHDAEARAATMPALGAVVPALPPVPLVPPRQAIITTFHQANAAALLAVAVATALWSRRLLRPVTDIMETPIDTAAAP